MESQNPVIRMDHFASLIEQAVDGAQAEVSGDGSKFLARVVSASFEGLSTVQRHRQVYAALNEHIQSGAIHALSIRALTPAEASVEKP